MYNSVVRPMHQVCERNVEVPTILLEPFRPGEPDQVFVQWFGESTDCDLNGMQFRFNVPLSLWSSDWIGRPELFRVILLGQIRDWPNKIAIESLEELLGKTRDSWIIWVTSAHYGTEHSDGRGPACFVIPMTVMLADPNCGVITPQKYCDTSVLDREVERFREIND